MYPSATAAVMLCNRLPPTPAADSQPSFSCPLIRTVWLGWGAGGLAGQLGLRLHLGLSLTVGGTRGCSSSLCAEAQAERVALSGEALSIEDYWSRRAVAPRV